MKTLHTAPSFGKILRFWFGFITTLTEGTQTKSSPQVTVTFGGDENRATAVDKVGSTYILRDAGLLFQGSRRYFKQNSMYLELKISYKEALSFVFGGVGKRLLQTYAMGTAIGSISNIFGRIMTLDPATKHIRRTKNNGSSII